MEARANKAKVHEYWNANPCETDEYVQREGGTSRLLGPEPLSREYFDAMESARYATQSDIMAFAQFTRYRGQRVLEIGVGGGNDFIQWVRAGAEAHGIDLTEAAIEMTQARLTAYGLTCAELRTADAEALPFPDNYFDLVYSWGVLHHTPQTEQAIAEAVRVAKPGGTIKLMLYNRHSLVAIREWTRHALLRGKPFRSLDNVLYCNVESIGTKAYSKQQVRQILSQLAVENVVLDAAASTREFGGPMDTSLKRRTLFVGRYLLTLLLGLNNADWFMKIRFNKKNNS